MSSYFFIFKNGPQTYPQNKTTNKNASNFTQFKLRLQTLCKTFFSTPSPIHYFKLRREKIKNNNIEGCIIDI